MDICIPELVCPEDYDCKSAKLEASLSWLLAKAGVNWRNESGICADECSSLLTPSVINGLSSGFFYFKAMCTIFPKDIKFFDQSHLSIVRWLLRQGFEVLPEEINFDILKKTDPVDQDMHITLIDKIMAAFIYQTLSVENVVKAIRRFSTFSASSELPSTIEETIVFWSNKVSQTMCEKYQSFLVPELNSEFKIDGNHSFYDCLIVNELEDFAWGRSLACLLSFYRPDKMIFEDICLDENSGIADSLYNLQLCAEVCSQIFDFPTSTSEAQLLHLTVTDVFYAHVHLTVNLMTFFADLFECFELSNTLCSENAKAGGQEVLSIKLPKISDVTKRSFYGTTKDEDMKVLPSSRTSSLLPLRRDINQKEETNDENGTKFGPFSEHCLIRKAICIDANENTKHKNHNAQDHQSSDAEEIVSIRDASSIDLSSSSREIVGNHFPMPCSTSSSCSSREAFVHCNNSKSHSFERPHNAQEAPNFGHYRARPPPPFSSTNDSDSHNLSIPISKPKNYDPITKLKTNARDSMLQNDRHVRYCHDLGLISGLTKFRRQSGSGFPKLALSSQYPSDGNLNNYNTLADDDDEVCGITGEAADDEEFATPPEEFGQRNDVYAGKDYFNNSNSNLSKINGTSSKEVNCRKNFLESSNGASNQLLKTSWLRQKKLACPEDEAVDGVRPTKKEAQRNGTFRVVKGCKDEVTDFEENKTKNLCSSPTTSPMSSSPKTSFSLLKQKRPKTKKVQDITNAPTISQPKSNLTLGKTTWIHSLSGGNASVVKDNDSLNSPSSNMSSKMGFLKMELTEKRRQIEGKKLSSEILWSKQRQQVGTEAFMQVVKGHKIMKSCDKDFGQTMEKIVESLSPDKDAPVLQNFGQAFDSRTAESGPRGNLSEYEKYSNKGVVNNHPDLYSSKENNLSVKNEFSVISQNVDEASQNKDLAQGFENNLDTVRTIDHLTHSLSELKGEVKRLSLEQDQLKGFVSVSQTPVTKINKKLRPTQTQQKDILSHLQRTKPYSSPTKVPDLVPYENCYSKPQFDNESLQHQPKPTTHISTATKSLSYQHMPSHTYSSQLISESRPVGVGGTGSSCTTPMYSVYTTLPNKRAHRPLSSDGRFMQIPEYLPPNELTYEYPNDVLSSYQHPLMTLPHPYAAPHSSSHIAYQFPLRDHVGNVNIMRHHPSSIAFTIPNDPPNLLQHNILPDWPPTSYHGNYPSNYQIGDKVPPSFVPGVAPVASFASDFNTMHFPDPNQVIVTLNSNHPQSPQYSPIHFRQKSFDLTNEPASLYATPEKSKQAVVTNLSEMESHLDGGHAFPEKKVGVKEIKHTECSQHNLDKASLPREDVTDFENQPSNKSDNNALRSPIENLNGDGEPADVDEMKLWKSAEEEHEALAQSSGLEEKRKTIKENPVAFVVSQSSNENINMDELERRKQRLEEMHAKRREEQEMKRLKLERDAIIKKELQRQREEQALQKRTEDRARREAIYQTYMQKKLEGFGEEEVGSKGDHSTVPRAVSSHPQVGPTSATKRQKSARTARHAGTPSIEDKTKEQQFAGANASPLPHSQEAQTPLAKASTISNASSEEKESAKEYTGPKLFVKPCHKSNRNIIENAISHCCLAGVVNQETKAKVLEVLKNSESKHFVILFRDVGMQYRGLYTYDLEEETITKIQGVGPKALTNKHIEKFFKYNSGSKNFSEVSSTKHLSATIDAITLYGAVWQRLKASALAGSKRNLT